MKLTAPIVFPPFRLDPANEQLWRDNTLLSLPPKVFAVLRYLVENPGRLVTKKELFAAVWPDTRVSENILKGYIHDLREVLGDGSDAPRFIETVPRRGHRFIAPLSTTSLVTSSQYSVASRRGQSRVPRLASSVPGPSSPTPNTQHPTPHLVGREAELTRLHQALEKAQRGVRQMAFITGEPGIGKSSVVEAFLSGMGDHSLWLGRGQCVEQYGAGEAYLPVLEALSRVGRAPGGEQLIALLKQYAPTWLVQMPALLDAAELEALQRRVAGATKERMLREMVEAVEGLTAERTLVLWLEDLHWADYSTLDWLAAIAQRSGPARLLVLGTYRPADVSVSGHPLKAVKQELLARRQCEELWLQFLSPTEISQYLTLRYPHHQFPERLGEAFHHRTDGNPLFLVNMVDYLVAQGAIAKIDGQWRLGVPVEEVTQGVPESLRQLIEKHIERLNEEQQRLLEAASVVGHEFSAAAVAAGVEATIEQVEERCEELVRRGQFLRALGPATLPDGTVAGRYGFLHALYQTMLYERVPAIRRVRLHRRVGESGERTYGAQAGEIAAELAVHFERGHDAQRAVKYLQLAAENVLRRHAHREAAAYQHRALALLSTLPDAPKKRQEELALQLALGVSLTVTKGFADPEVERAYARARELCQHIGDAPALVPVLYGLWNFYLVRAQLRSAQELADQMLTIAEREHEAVFLLAAHNAQTQSLFQVGNFAAARPHPERVLALYDPSTHNVLARDYGEDLGVSCRVFTIWLLWLLGYPQQALQHAQTVRDIAEALSHPFSLAQALYFGGMLYHHFRDVRKAREVSEALMVLCREQDFALWLSGGMTLHGWALVEAGHEREGIAELRQGIHEWQATGAEIWLPLMRTLLAEAHGKAGQPQDGLAVIEEALAVTRASGEAWYDAELYRLKGELSLQARQVQGKSKASHKQGKRKSTGTPPQPLIPDPQAEAQACFLKAIDVAQQQQAKSLELRAVMSLSQLWQQQGKKKEARQLLAEIYDWFTEGLDTTDLRDAKTLLDAWA